LGLARQHITEIHGFILLLIKTRWLRTEGKQKRKYSLQRIVR
jgi:hypothetical protein